MLSDELSDAISQIEAFRDATTEPHASWYGDMTEEINAVIAPMNALQEYLDCPLPDNGARRAALRCRLGLPPDPTEVRICFGCGKRGVPLGQPRRADVPVLTPTDLAAVGVVLLCRSCAAAERKAAGAQPSPHLTA